jgi:hypothetical protein
MLFWCNVGFAGDYALEGKIPAGSKKKLLCKITNSGSKTKGTSIHNGRAYCHSFWQKHYIYFPQYKTEIIWNGQDIAWFVYQNVNQRMKCTNFICKKGDGTLMKIAYSRDEALTIANPEYAKKLEEDKKKERKKVKAEKKITSSSQSSSTDPKIAQAKQICKDLGFKTNTEKFADCALKMMSMQFEASNKVATSSGGTKQEITLKHKQDYDIFDAMIDVSNVMRQSNSSSSSGRGKCRIFQHTYHADLICR